MGGPRRRLGGAALPVRADCGGGQRCPVAAMGGQACRLGMPVLRLPHGGPRCVELPRQGVVPWVWPHQGQGAVAAGVARFGRQGGERQGRGADGGAHRPWGAAPPQGGPVEAREARLRRRMWRRLNPRVPRLRRRTGWPKRLRRPRTRRR